MRDLRTFLEQLSLSLSLSLSLIIDSAQVFDQHEYRMRVLIDF